MGSVLKLDPASPDDDRELEFELAYQRSLTTAQRFQMMLRKSRSSRPTATAPCRRRRRANNRNYAYIQVFTP